MAGSKVLALRAERHAALTYFQQLMDDEWEAPSTAPGWTVKDVASHLTATCALAFRPLDMARVMRTHDIEGLNERLIDRYRRQSPQYVLREFGLASARLIAFLMPGAKGPLGLARLPLGNLGTYPVHLFPSMYLFDWHTHLRLDIAPALDRPVPLTDVGRLKAIIEWLLAVLEQTHRGSGRELERPLTLTLTGSGGGTWAISAHPKGNGLMQVTPGTARGAAATITGRSIDFPAWSTTRRPWRGANLQLTGDTDYATRFLDSVNLI